MLDQNNDEAWPQMYYHTPHAVACNFVEPPVLQLVEAEGEVHQQPFFAIYTCISLLKRILSSAAASSYFFFCSGVKALQRSPIMVPNSTNFMPGNSFMICGRMSKVNKTKDPRARFGAAGSLAFFALR
mmetsp:Transcript_6051/g.9256  ORF Transcript_6051/g.9256 Transcript_6051/m.9256 type:complete len:128 (-) Transcript_6051:1037-1420(-)